jgi:hypothetical protein
MWGHAGFGANCPLVGPQPDIQAWMFRTRSAERAVATHGFKVIFGSHIPFAKLAVLAKRHNERLTFTAGLLPRLSECSELPFLGLDTPLRANCVEEHLCGP